MKPADIILKAAYFLEPHTLKLSRDVALVIRSGVIDHVVADGESLPEAKQTFDCGDAVIAPAFINAHAHLDLSHLRAAPLDGDNFGEWLSAVVASRAAPVSLIETAAELTLNEMVATGCAGVLDILATNQGAEEVAAATLRAGVRAAIAVEILSPDPDAEAFMFGKTKELIAKIRKIVFAHMGEDDLSYRERLLSGRRSPQVGLSPHAPYSVSPRLYKELAEFCASRLMLQTTHSNESLAEREFLVEGKGKLEPLYAAMGLDTSKMRWTTRDGLTTWIEDVLPSIVRGKNDTLHAHCYDLSDENVAQLGSNQQTIAYCPRSRRYFGHPDFRMRDLLDAGAKITIGTDSLGSTPSFNMMEELQVARADLSDQVTSEELFRAATTVGLREIFAPLASDEELSRVADLQVLRTPTNFDENDPCRSLIESGPLCLTTLVDGKVRFRHL